MHHTTVRLVGYAFLAAGAITGALNGVVSRLVFDAGWSPRDLAGARVLGAALVLGPLLLPHLRRLGRRDIGTLALFGLVGVVLAQWLYYEAIDRIDIAVALVIVFTAPALVAIYQRLFHDERLAPQTVVGIAVAVVGVIASVVGAGAGDGVVTGLGIAIAVAAMLAYAAQVVIASRLPRSLPSTAATGGAMIAGSLVWLVAHPLWTWPFDGLDDQASLGPAIDRTAPLAVLVLFVALVGTAFTYTCLVLGAGRVGPGATSVVGMLEPASASILAWAILDQSLNPVQVVGIAAAVGGIATAERYRLRQTDTSARRGRPASSDASRPSHRDGGA